MGERKDLLQNARKIERRVTGRHKLSDDQLEKVAGGFVEDEGWAAGYEIVCPECGADTKCSFNTFVLDNSVRLAGYECLNPACRFVFGVDSEGSYWR